MRLLPRTDALCRVQEVGTARARTTESARLAQHDHKGNGTNTHGDHEQQDPTGHAPVLTWPAHAHVLIPENITTPNDPNKIVGDHAATTGWM